MFKESIANYVRIMKKLFVIFSCFMIVAIMVSLTFAFSQFVAFYVIAPLLIVAYLVAYGFYAIRVSMSVVIAVEVTDLVIHLKTKRRTFT